MVISFTFVLLVLATTFVTCKIHHHEEEHQHVTFLVNLFTLNGKPDKQLKKYLRAQSSAGARGRVVTGNLDKEGVFLYPTRHNLFNVLYHSTTSPYDGYTPLAEASAVGGMYKSHAWTHAEMIQHRVLRLLGKKPTFIIEVGSFVGSGAIHALAPLLTRQPKDYSGSGSGSGSDNDRNNAEDGILLCVDTWLGDVNMRINPAFDPLTLPLHGTVRLFDIFMSNVLFHNMQDVIYPLTLPSIVAARLLGHQAWRADVVYIDSAHELGETLIELVMYYQLLRVGGVLMGDDYSSFPAVKHDVDAFASYVGSPLTVVEGQWFLVKRDELR